MAMPMPQGAPRPMGGTQAPSPQPGGPNMGAPKAAPQGPSAPAGGPVQILASSMHGLMQVGHMMTQSKVIPPQEAQQFMQLVGQLDQFIRNVLAKPPQGAPGAPQPGSQPAAMPRPQMAMGAQARPM